MQIKYSIFISSCYKTLKEERQYAINAVLKMGFFPVAMEHFAVGNFEDVKLWLDHSDAVILLIGDDYGSTDADGVSWTEREYRYAKEKGIHIFPLELPALTALRQKDILTETEKKQLQFAKLVNSDFYLCPISQPNDFYEKISTHFLLDENFKANATGWERRTNEKVWAQEHAVFNLAGIWHSFHVSNDDPTYIRIGTVTLYQSFNSRQFSELDGKGLNYNCVFDPETNSIEEDRSKNTKFQVDYELYVTSSDQTIDKIVGIYAASRNFSGTFADEIVTKGIAKGIHSFDAFEYDEEGRIKIMFGSFSNAGQTKEGEILLFKSLEERNQYLLDNYYNVLENNTRKK